MKQEEKQLLLTDLCARLAFHCRVFYEYVDDLDNKTYGYSLTLNTWCIDEFNANKAIVKPYLRPMSSMTEEEKRKFQSFFPGCFGDQWLDIEEGIIEIFECSSTMTLYLYDFERMIDWLNAHHFDYRGLIERGLAIEVTEDNNPYKD